MNNVLINTVNFPPDHTGAGLRALRLCERLSNKYGYHFKVLCLKKEKSYPGQKINSNIGITRLKLTDERGLKFPIHIIQAFIKTNSYMLKNRKEIDIIHFFSFSWMSRMIMLSNILFYRKKTILEVTLDGSDDPTSLVNDGIRNRIFSGFTKSLLTKIDEFIVGSPYAFKSCISIGIDEKKVSIKPHPCDKKEFGKISFDRKYGLRKKLGLPAKKFILFNIGRLQPRKNQLFLVECVNALKNKDVVIVFAGPHDEKETYIKEIKEYIEAQNLQNQVFFIGNIKNINEYMIASDLFVFASRAEGFPNVITEAIMSGLPIITTNLECIRGYILSDIGRIVKTDDKHHNNVKKFSENINKVFKKDIKFNRASIRESGIKKFSTEKIDEEYNQAYKDLLKK